MTSVSGVEDYLSMGGKEYGQYNMVYQIPHIHPVFLFLQAYRVHHVLQDCLLCRRD